MSNEIKWSKAQQAAIDSNHTNELLNAGAGSGKTAVLTAHVIKILESGYDLDNLLIMTFTNAAANQMKQKIKGKIEKDPELRKKFGDKIDAAHIETFDAFFLFLVKKYHYILNINKNINILDGNVETVLIKQTIDDVINEAYDNPSETFKDLIRNYCVKDDDLVYEMLSSFIKLASLEIDKDKFYDEFVFKYYNDEFIQKMINERFNNLHEILDAIASGAEKLEDDRDRDQIIEFINEVKSYKTYDELYFKTCEKTLPTKPKNAGSTDADYRKALKDLFDKNFKLKDSDFGSSEEIKHLYMSSKPYCIEMIKMAKEIEKRLLDYKFKHNVFSFNDVASMALKLTENPDILKEIRSQFRYILVDEYQDTSDIQEAMLKKLEDDNIFMVGDVKQSIYRFRNANCLIFQNKYNKYKHTGVGGHVIDMTQNFRSRPELVNAFDDMFAQLMTKKVNLIDYNDGHNTFAGNVSYEDKDKKANQKYGFTLVKYQRDLQINAYEQEAEIIAKDIKEKIENKYLILHDGKLVPATYSDFAIIVDRGSSFDIFKRVFVKNQIPLYVYNDEKVTARTMFLLTPNLLKVYKGVKDNNYDETFKHAFMSVGRSFISDLDDETIYSCINSNNYECTSIVLKIKKVIKNNYNSSLYDVITSLFEEFDVYNRIKSIGDYNVISHDIEILLNQFKSLDSLFYDLNEAIKYFEAAHDFEIEMKASPIKESDNSCILLNIHKSKGLEYPFVYFPGLFKEFNRQESKSSKALSKEYGFILPVINERKTLKNLARNLNKRKLDFDDFEEKLRLWYVAVTRAKEAAIILDMEDDKMPILDIRNALSFHEFLKAVTFDPKDVMSLAKLHEINYKLLENEVPDGAKEIKKEINTTFTLLKNKEIDYKEVIKTRASKTLSSDADESALEFGNKLHLLLELVDIETKDLSYIKDIKERHYVKNVIDLPIFDGVDNEHIRHEYGFYDENNELLGYIDCLLIKDKEIDIIDFKLKGIEDKAYEKQLQTYYDYIKKKTDKKVKTFLISIIDGTLKEVKISE